MYIDFVQMFLVQVTLRGQFALLGIQKVFLLCRTTHILDRHSVSMQIPTHMF